MHFQVLYDIGVVSTKEPFQRLVSQGMILGEVEYTAFKNAAGGATSNASVPDLLFFCLCPTLFAVFAELPNPGAMVPPQANLSQKTTPRPSP